MLLEMSSAVSLHTIYGGPGQHTYVHIYIDVHVPGLPHLLTYSLIQSRRCPCVYCLHVLILTSTRIIQQYCMYAYAHGYGISEVLAPHAHQKHVINTASSPFSCNWSVRVVQIIKSSAYVRFMQLGNMLVYSGRMELAAGMVSDISCYSGDTITRPCLRPSPAYISIQVVVHRVKSIPATIIAK